MESRNNLVQTCCSNSCQRDFIQERSLLYRLPSRKLIFELIKQMTRECHFSSTLLKKKNVSRYKTINCLLLYHWVYDIVMLSVPEESRKLVNYFEILKNNLLFYRVQENSYYFIELLILWNSAFKII